MYYVYILYADAHDKFYIGQTKDLSSRLHFHNHLSQKSFTAKYRPWKIVWSIEVPNQKIAVRIERFIKKKKSRDFLEALVHGNFQIDLDSFLNSDG